MVAKMINRKILLNREEIKKGSEEGKTALKVLLASNISLRQRLDF